MASKRRATITPIVWEVWQCEPDWRFVGTIAESWGDHVRWQARLYGGSHDAILGHYSTKAAAKAALLREFDKVERR